MWHRVVMALDVDVIIERQAADAPFGIHECLRWQRRQRRLVQLLEQLAAADAELAHRPGIEGLDRRRDRRIELSQREEPLMAQTRQNPALHHQHASLYLGLVAWAAHPCRQDRR